MAGGVQGTNHLKAHGKPLCGDQYGYMWDEPTFAGMVKKGNACIACKRTQERDAIARLMGKPFETEELKTTLTKNEDGDLIAVTLTDEDHRIERVFWMRDSGPIPLTE